MQSGYDLYSREWWSTQFTTYSTGHLSLMSECMIEILGDWTVEIESFVDGHDIERCNEYGHWVQSSCPQFRSDEKYRVKLKFQRINGVECPVPLKDLARIKTLMVVYIACISDEKKLHKPAEGWHDLKTVINRGLLFETIEDAEATTLALLEVIG